ncbi:MAG: hypothetical protein HKN16_09550 [Saprospiraceae bacterium]|nr:hypothetical protein [Saprospiraceae bacterium]
MKNPITILLLLPVLLLFSCVPSMDEELVATHYEFAGDWVVDSYLLNSQEQMGQNLSSFLIDFAHQDATSGKSIWEWTNISGDRNQDESHYTLSADGNTILLFGQEYRMEYNDGILTLQGISGQAQYLIQATR